MWAIREPLGIQNFETRLGIRENGIVNRTGASPSGGSSYTPGPKIDGGLKPYGGSYDTLGPAEMR